MTDEQLEAELRRALRDARVDYDAAGADAMIANATDAPLLPERTAWIAPVAAAAAVVVIGGGAALLATRGGAGSPDGAPAGGGGGCGAGASTAPSVVPSASSSAPAATGTPSTTRVVILPGTSAVVTSGASGLSLLPSASPSSTATVTTRPDGTPSRYLPPGRSTAPGSVGRVSPGRPSFTPMSDRPGTGVSSAPVAPTSTVPPSPTASRRPVMSDPASTPAPTCAPSDARSSVPPGPSRAPRSTPPTTSVPVPVSMSSASGTVDRVCFVLNTRTGRIAKRVPCPLPSNGSPVLPRSSAPRG